MIASAWVLAILLRYGWPLEEEVVNTFWIVLPIVIITQSWIIGYQGLHQGIWRFTSLPDLTVILRSVIIGSLAIVLILVLVNRLDTIPRSSLLFYPLLLTFLLGLPRLLYRLWHEHSLHFLLATNTRKKVLILGAGTLGDRLVRDMLRNPHLGYQPIGFLDDNRRLYGGKVQGIPVLGGIEQLQTLVYSLQIELIIIAVNSATEPQMRRIVEQCEHCQIPFHILPKDNLVTEQIPLQSLRDVAIEDLLGREKVELDWHKLQEGICQQVILVSGGGGSIGAELCQQIARLSPSALIVIERCEFNLYQVEMQLRQTHPDCPLHAYLGDITDAKLVDVLLKRHQPNLVFHAAAYKHVPLLQGQGREAIRNNVLGTQILAEAVARQGCRTFIMISTDKAVNPTNVMGATKRAAEIFCQTMNGRTATRFVTVRFGNVLGSAGSVVPLFKTQIANGGPVTVTHPDITRYFMTIPEACQLILQAAIMGQGGEIFVLDMGKPIKIRYLAEQMIRLAGKIPDKDLEIIYTGLRPGEKLDEELFHCEEKRGQTPHPKVLLAAHRNPDLPVLQTHWELLRKSCENYEETNMLRILSQIVPEWDRKT